LNLIICEDQSILLDGLASSFAKDPSIKVVGTVTSALDILPLLKKVSADVVLTDIITEGKKNALEVVGQIKEEFPDVKVVAITGFPDVTFMETAKKVGVNSFVYKNISTVELISVIKNTVAGYSVFPSVDNTKNLLLSTLNDVELKILRSYCEGLERDAIAKELFMSQSSLKAHISSILQKTGFPSIARVAIYAVSSGLIFAEK